jgi:type 2 lantibiotic biosynthesis protein LanM
MSRGALASSVWYAALTLAERAELLRLTPGVTRRAHAVSEQAERRLDRWCAQFHGESSERFAQRLAEENVTVEDLGYLLDEPAETVRERMQEVPGWLQRLSRAYARTANCDSNSADSALDPKAARVLEIVEPLVTEARQQLRAAISNLDEADPTSPFDPRSVDRLFYPALAYKLLPMLAKTIALEVNVARLEGWLEGNSGEERFQNFIEQLRQPHRAVGFFHEYPVLARQIVTIVDHWVETSLEFLVRLREDWTEIQDILHPGQVLGCLEAVEDAGDTHRRGRSVMIGRFRNGCQLVYKPRSLAIDQHMQELLQWLNQRGARPPFRTLTLLDRATHGWVEFVQSETCTSPEDVRDFFERIGGYLALFYVVRATDLHHENVIAAGAHPVIVDLETVWQPSETDLDLSDASMLARDALVASVLTSGLLPRRVWASAESDGVDLSGIGGDAGQTSPNRMPRWQDAGTDEVHLTREHVRLDGADNRVSINGVEVDPLAYAERIVAGFESTYRLLLNHRDELLASDGPLAAFTGDELRVVLRNTRTYGELLSESFHPDVLHNALDRDRLFDRLWVRTLESPEVARVVRVELADLARGDIPIFTTHTDSRDIWTSTGTRITDFFRNSGHDLVEGRIRELSERDLAHQKWIVRGSLATLSGDRDRVEHVRQVKVEATPDVTRARLLASACSIGDRVLSLAFRGEHDAAWLGLTLSRDQHWFLAPLGPNLGDGMAGVALFLGYLGAVTGEKRYTDTARAALIALRNLLRRYPAMLSSIGGFAGWGGVIYCMAHLATLWNDPSLIEESVGYMTRLREFIEDDQELDIMGGAAGGILSLLSLHRAAPSRNVLETAIQCGEVLVARAVAAEPGAGLPPRMAASGPLTGFSHGTAGAALALLELAECTSIQRFRQSAFSMLEYERHLFSPAEGNWPDLRVFNRRGAEGPSGPAAFMVAWCHGAPGIGLSRLRMLRLIDDAAMRTEIERALETTVSRGFGLNHSLCHGDLGNLEAVLEANRVLAGSEWTEHLERLLVRVVSSTTESGWRCGNPLGLESPELLTGLAGIGYELLRIADPDRVPSVLALAPPADRDNPLCAR